MLRLRQSNQKIDTVFVLLLFLLFAMTATVLVIIGVKQYKITADSMNYNYEVRTASSYLTEKVRQNDCGDGISIITIETDNNLSVDAISLSSEINDINYYTYIYYYDGYLRELFVSEDSVYSLESGLKIIELSDLSLSDEQGGIIKAVITDTNGGASTLLLSTKSLSRG